MKACRTASQTASNSSNRAGVDIRCASQKSVSGRPATKSIRLASSDGKSSTLSSPTEAGTSSDDAAMAVGVDTNQVDANGYYLTNPDGSFVGSTLRNHAARINADGSLDAAFNPGFGFGSIA